VESRLEYLVTLHALERDLPPPGSMTLILDAGGGPGRYTIALAERSYCMTLLDLSPGNIALARERVAEAAPQIAGCVEEICEGSFTDLSGFEDARFDAVLCLGGAFSHAVDAAARAQALVEMRRVARPGAPLFVSGINLIGLIRSTVRQPSLWAEYFPASYEAFLQSRNPGEGRWPVWRQLLLATCDHPNIVGVSASLLAVARSHS